MILIKKLIVLTLQCLWFLAIAMPIMLYLERPPVSNYNKREIDPSTLRVAPGQDLKINISANISNKECDAMVVRTITDSTGRPFEFASELRPQQVSYQIELTVPLGTYPGPAQYTAKIFWSCNFMQNWFPKIITQSPLLFEILPADGQLPMPQQQGVYEAPEQKSELAIKNK